MYSRASLISSLLNVVSPSSSRILIRSWIIEIFHPASGGAGKNCFFRTETSEKGREGSIAQSKLMLRAFELLKITKISNYQETFRLKSARILSNLRLNSKMELLIKKRTCSSDGGKNNPLRPHS